MTANDHSSPDRLDSWKAIADYLGRDVRTARRWEQERDLPVHRVPGSGRSAVFAFPAEIDQWLLADAPERVVRQSDHNRTPPRNRWPLALAGSVVAILGAVWWAVGTTRPATVSAVRVSPRDVVATDAADRMVWSFEYPVPMGQVPTEPRASVLEDGGVLLSAASFKWAEAGTTAGGRLWHLSADGEVEWSHDVDDALVTYGAQTHRSPWLLRDWMEQPRDGGSVVAAAWTHEVWWPSFVQVIDWAGAILFRFDNPGWVYTVRWMDSDAGILMASGVSNVHDAGMASLLDLSTGPSQAPASDEVAFRCDGCGAGRPRRYVVLPRSEVNRALGGFVNLATAEVRDTRILVRTSESLTNDAAWIGAEVVYEFDSALQLQRATFGDRYWDIHARLEQAGRLSHTRASCPNRDGPPAIREWTPDQGWRDVLPAGTTRDGR